MNKAILISIQPKHVANILNGKKTVEVRKTFPKEYLSKNKNFEAYTVYIYCTKDKKYANLVNRGGFLTGMVVARFDLIAITPIHAINANYWTDEACITEEEMQKYLNGGKGYIWHIDNLQIFDKPKELSEFKRVPYEKCGQYDSKGLVWCGRCPYGIEEGYGCDCKYNAPLKAPQSWCYVEESV